MKILAIDPGNIESAYCVIEDEEYEPLGDYENIEVIGNVWENSDLLKGE